MNKKNKLSPIHPGEILREELEYLAISQVELARSARQ